MDPGRLSRGRSYAAPRRRKQFAIEDGAVVATMVGNKNAYFGVYETPYYDVVVRFRRIPESSWKKILERLGSNANWVTHLLLGEVPPSIEGAFTGRNRLLPANANDYTSDCSCPDWANPCKHVAGVYYHLAALLDRDPLLLFELRGMQRARLRRVLAKSEFGAALTSEAARVPDPAEWAAKTRFPPVDSEQANASPADLRSFWRGRPLPKDAGTDQGDPPVSALLLRREGDYPEFWTRHGSFIEAMAAFYERVSKGLPRTVPSSPSGGRLP